MSIHIAIVDDDPGMGEYLQLLMKENGYQAVLHPTPGRFFDSIAKSRPNLVILDMHLPGMHGREVIRVLRANPETRHIFIIAISGEQKSTTDIVSAVQAGADEYMAKPLDAQLLLVRINALLRRGQDFSESHPNIRAGALLISPEERTVRHNNREVALTRLEFDLLLYLVQHPNRIMTRGLILESVWHGNSAMTSRTVDKHVESLRHKLDGFGKHIQTIVRVGYMLKI